jgi:hypothetical protein
MFTIQPMFSFTHDFPFITLNATLNHITKATVGDPVMKNNNVSTAVAQQIAVDFLRKRKNTQKVDVSTIEQKNEVWVVRGTCPIDLEGHPWAEKFEVVIDQRGRVKSTDFSLL